ncbi:MAG: LysR family transcriptional regulator, partial [Comamonas sp.]
GGGVATVSQAVMAGLGVAVLAPRMLPLGAVDVGAKLGLPALPRQPVLLHSSTRTAEAPRARAAQAQLAAAYRSAIRP